MTALAVATTPTHIMNIAQAALAGYVEPDLDCLVLDYRREIGSYNSAVLAGSVAYFADVLPRSHFRIKHLWRGVSNIQIARAVRGSGDFYDTLVLGIYPSALWARSPIRRKEGRTLFVDDGASSLNLDFDRLLNDGASLAHGRIYRLVLESIAGPKVPSAETPLIYSAFPLPDGPYPSVRHEYDELRVVTVAKPPIGASRELHEAVWIDSNFARLGAECHSQLISSAVEQLGVRAIVPHRRTPRAFVDKISRQFGLHVVRPQVPVELLISFWTASNIQLFTPPTSLVLTAGSFVQSPGRLTLVRISDWLRECVVAPKGVRQRGIKSEIEHADMMQSYVEPGAIWSVDSLY